MNNPLLALKLSLIRLAKKREIIIGDKSFMLEMLDRATGTGADLDYVMQVSKHAGKHREYYRLKFK